MRLLWLLLLTSLLLRLETISSDRCVRSRETLVSSPVNDRGGRSGRPERPSDSLLVWLARPDGSLIFDEKYYVNSARVIAGIQPEQDIYQDRPLGLDPNTEHPPLAKVLVAGMLLLVGNNPYAWRLPSVIFGLVAILYMYRVGRRVSGDPYVGLLAATLLAFDNLFFVHGRIFTLDISMLAFMLLGLDLYLGAPVRAGRWRFRAGRPLQAAGRVRPVRLDRRTSCCGCSARTASAALRAPSRRLSRARADLAAGRSCCCSGHYRPRSGSATTSRSSTSSHILSYAQLLRRQAPSGVESYAWQWLWNDVQIPYLKVEQQVKAG